MKRIHFFLQILLTAFVLSVPEVAAQKSNGTMAYTVSMDAPQAHYYHVEFRYEGSYNIDLDLYSSGFTLHQTGENYDSLTGMGDALYFELFTSEQTGLATGTYTYNSEASEVPGTFDYAACYIHFNNRHGSGTIYQINAGTLTKQKRKYI